MRRYWTIFRLALVGAGAFLYGESMKEDEVDLEKWWTHVRRLGGFNDADFEDEFRTRVDTLLHAKWIIPMSQNTQPVLLEKLDAGDLVPAAPKTAVEPAKSEFREYLVDHSIAVSGGRIVGILPRQEAKKRWVGTVEEELPDSVVMPGLVNCHTHSPMNLFRSWVDGISLGEWLQEYIWPSERRFVSPEFVRLGTQLAIAEMLSSGVTTFNDMYFFPEDSAAVAQKMGIRALIGLPVLEFPSNYAENAAEYLAKGQALLDKQTSQRKRQEQQLVRFAWAPHAPYTVGDATWQRIVELADHYDVKIHTHLHETSLNISDSLTNYGCRPIERLAKLGVLSPRLIAVHLTQLVPTDIRLLKEKGVAVVHCPESNLKLASGICPAGHLVRSGLRVGLGTDSSASNDDLDLLGEIRTASLLDHYASGDVRPSLSRYQLLEMATIGGARVLGLDDEIGSLEPGKAADLISIQINTFPVYNPLSTLCNSGGNRVTNVWVAGNRLVKDSRLVDVDLPALHTLAQQWGQKLAAARTDP